VRRVFALDKPDIMAMKAGNTELEGKALGDVLLEPTKIYVKPVLALIDKLGAEKIKGISHITGGGFYENIPRSIPEGLGARIQKSAVKVLPIFDMIAEVGAISEHDMFNTFNMGVGMSIVVAPEDADRAIEILRANGEDASIIGEIVESADKIEIV
jgi:phosphoribosylformylglycinamidine cyclo-ligase